MPDPAPEKPKWLAWLLVGVIVVAAFGFGWYAAEHEAVGRVLNTVMRWANWLYLGLAVVAGLGWLVSKLDGKPGDGGR